MNGERRTAGSEEAESSGRSPRRDPGRRRVLLLDEITDAAGVVFAERGVNNTSVQDVADHLGVSRAALYYHVKSRDHLLRLVIGNYISLHRQWLHDLRERADLTPEQRLREAMRILTRGFHSHPHLSRIFLRAEMELPEDVREEQRRTRRVIHREMELIVADGIKDGSFIDTDPLVITFAIFGMINWMHVWYVPGGRLHVEEVADAFTDLVLRGIRRDPDEGANATPIASIAKMRGLLDQLEDQVAGADGDRPAQRKRVQRGW